METKEITIEDIKKVMDMIKKENTCHRCGTERNLTILGICGIDYIPLFCKCQAEKLCRTPYVQKQVKLINEFAKASHNKENHGK